MNQRHVFEAALPKRNFLIKTGNFFTRAGVNFLIRFKKSNTYIELICALLIILFIYTGVHKLMDIGKFKYEMGRSPFIENMAGFIAYTLPPSEILLSLLLIVKKTRLLGLYLSFGLMSLFTGYIWLMLNYAYDLPCSCGGIISKLSWDEHLVFNACSSALCLIAILLYHRVIQSKIENSQINKR